MDEPLSTWMLNFVYRCVLKIAKIRRIGATTIYVTHDQTEAMTLADRIVISLLPRTLQVLVQSDGVNKLELLKKCTKTQ